MYRTYNNKFPETLLANCLDTKFGNSISNLVRAMIESNAFTNENSDLGYNHLLTKRFRAEIFKKGPTLTSVLEECSSTMKKPPQGSSNNIPPKSFVFNEAFKAKCDTFVERYKLLNEKVCLIGF